MGDRVGVRVGGQFVLNPSESAILFVAGGVGINPLYGMLRSLCAHSADDGGDTTVTPPRVALLYTARTRDELLFANELNALARRSPHRTRFQLGATREAASQTPPALTPATVPAAAEDGNGACGALSGRVGESQLEEALRWLGCEPNAVRAGRGVPWRPASRAREPGTASDGCGASLGAYVCGPPRMTDEILAALRRMGVAQVHSEKWW